MWLLSEVHFSSESQSNKVARVQKRLVPAMLNLFAVVDVQIFISVASGILLLVFVRISWHFLRIPVNGLSLLPRAEPGLSLSQNVRPRKTKAAALCT